MVATAIYSVTMVLSLLWKETAFPLCRATERRWKRNVVSLMSSVIVVIRLIIIFIFNFDPCTQFPGNEKNYDMQCKKVQKSSWNEPYSSSSFTLSLLLLLHVYRDYSDTVTQTLYGHFT